MTSIKTIIAGVGGAKRAAAVLSEHADAPRDVLEPTIRMWMSRNAVPAAWRTILADVARAGGMKKLRASDLPLYRRAS